MLTLLVAAAAIGAAAPGGAVADQSSQPSSVAAGELTTGSSHTCAIIAARVRCWGYGGDGQLGYGNTRSIGDDEVPASIPPVDLGANRTATAVSAGNGHTCALLDDGTVRCWGFGANGRLGYGNTNTIGDDETPASAGPVFLGAEGGVALKAKAISAGNGHSCALLVNGMLRCWGFALDGRLGLGDTVPIGDTELPGSVRPIGLGDGRTAKAIAAGGFHTCALLDDNSVRCWGFGGDGRLGFNNILNIGREPGVTPDWTGPVYLGEAAGTLLTAKAITAGFGHTCVILTDGRVRCWGYNGSGRLGTRNTRSVGDDETPGTVVPVNLGAGRIATAIDAGEEHTCAVLDNGQVSCWGYAAYGQLGYANTRAVGDNEHPGDVGPVDVGAGGATAISAGFLHSCVTLQGGAVRCWGQGEHGRLGYCSHTSIGDDEKPGTTGPVALGVPGIAGIACPFVEPPPPPPPPPPPAATPTPTPTPIVVPDTPAPPAAGAGALAAALAAQAERVAALRDCRREVARKLGADRRRANALPAARRGAARRQAARRATARRSACMRQHGRFPGRVSGLKATAKASGRIELTFRVAGSIGSQPPAAQRYLVKQSLRPIRSAADFRRAAALCRGACSFDVERLDATAALSITDLRKGRRYYYAVAARDNVSGRKGPRSAAVSARAR